MLRGGDRGFYSARISVVEFAFLEKPRVDESLVILIRTRQVGCCLNKDGGEAALICDIETVLVLRLFDPISDCIHLVFSQYLHSSYCTPLSLDLVTHSWPWVLHLEAMRGKVTTGRCDFAGVPANIGWKISF